MQTASICGSELAYGAQQRGLLAVGNIEAVHIGEQNQPVGLDRGGQQRAQFIVVAESAHQFANRNAIIFIHHRNHAELEQLVQRILQIAVADGRSKVVAREQQLGHNFLPEKKLLVGVHQQALADGGAGLHERHGSRPLAEAEMSHAGGDCSRADNQILVAGKIELIDQGPHARGVDASSGRDQTGTDFDRRGAWRPLI